MSPADKTICFCNRVSEESIQHCISKGARTLGDVYDACGAGTGPCGGSCRSAIQALIQGHGSAAKASEALPDNPKASEAPLPLVEALSLFNRRYYWECHEVLEGLWMEEHGKARLFYQGIIQSAAALYHVLNANPQGVLRLAAEARKKLQAYLPAYFEIPLAELMRVLESYEKQAREILGKMRPGFDYDLLPKLELGPEMTSLQKNSP